MHQDTQSLELLDNLIGRARSLGADAADAVLVDGASLSLAWRMGALERLERSEDADIGLRVFVGKRQACVSSSDRSTTALDELAKRAVAMARAAPDDPYCGLAGPEQVIGNVPRIDIFSDAEPDAEALTAWAAAAEDAARAVPGVTNSEGAEAAWGRNRIAIAASNGFAQNYAVSYTSLSASVLAGTGTGMERDYDFRTAVYAEDMPDPADIGRTAGEKAVRRLNPQKMASGRFPVVFDPRVSGSMVGHFAGAINGSAVARGTSFLKDMMGKRVFADGIVIVDDPHRPRGLRSKPFDAEGIANKRRNLIENGVLTSWILDLATARQLGLETTGHAARGTGGPPSPSATNLHMAAGAISRDALIGGIERGLYVTEMMGFGVNPVTGDYSRGAAGFLIEDGQLAHPVSELTIAGNLKDMFLNITPADDLEFRYGTNAPTLRIDGMTVAGK
ncbi:MAG: TldD/PmbA family protein [Rhodospirillales bacterium]|nr:TldD/PmbA family protein [Rhodospirillales bacterium]MCW8862791.1 TldD/PmbA family protein [Rhodospirillales bacterium]MCW8953204.1 TldD/PmbA family protein [Rhodospirillales bacterium]MCW8969817.1 TldD/PmbA family protein [Rhodospirillales bacterium]MCW9002702.1 TldD/PmbA family protein [Rhodospirillales bacterium]